MLTEPGSSEFPMPWPDSLWAETALPLAEFPSAQGEHDADVVVVGAGYTGLSAALHLIHCGLRPIVIDANGVGWGASGRNGGVVSTKYRVSMPSVARSRGLDMARKMYFIGHEAVAAVEENVEANAIQGADLRMTGNLRCAHNAVALQALTAEASIMRDSFGDRSIRLLSAGEVAEETGSRSFVGGTLTPHAGMVHPLNYVRGLARAVHARGGTIFERSPAVRIGKTGGQIIVETPSARLTARKVVIATNAYSDLTHATADLSRTLIPFRSAMVATVPLEAAVFATMMVGQRTYSETRRMMRWFRPYQQRLIFGGRGAFGKADTPSAFTALERAMRRLYPQLEATPVSHRWSGLVGLTLDSVPHVGRIDDRLSYAVGYNGTGIAMASLMGRKVADIALGGAPDLALMEAARLRTVPMYAIRSPAVRLVAGWYQFLDAIGR